MQAAAPMRRERSHRPGAVAILAGVYFPLTPLIGHLVLCFCDDGQMNDQIAGFVAEARRFCALIESEELGGASAFEKECLVVLLRLSEQILRLPSADPPDPELPEPIPHEQWRSVQERIAKRTEHDLYWEVFEPFAENKPDVIHGSISDDLADIWRDVKPGLTTFDSGTPNSIEDAVWHWRFSFGSHWGHHVADAIRAFTALHAAEFTDNEGLQDK
jgi:uncharacterized protein DUF5063